MVDTPIDVDVKTKKKSKKKKKSKSVSWGAIIFLFVVGVLIPCCFIYLVVEGVDSGYWGGEPGYVRGNRFMVWVMDRFHIVIIGTGLSSVFFLILLFIKLFETIEAKLKKQT